MQWKISRDRNFKVGDRVRSYDFPHDQRHRNCYVEGVVVGVDASEWTVRIEVHIDMRSGVDAIDEGRPNARRHVWAPTGRGDVFNRHCCFKLARAQQ